MGGPDRDVDRLSGNEIALRSLDIDKRMPADHKPMLSAMLVALIAESVSRLDFDALDLEMLPLIENDICAPWLIGSLLVHAWQPSRTPS